MAGRQHLPEAEGQAGDGSGRRVGPAAQAQTKHSTEQRLLEHDRAKRGPERAPRTTARPSKYPRPGGPGTAIGWPAGPHSRRGSLSLKGPRRAPWASPGGARGGPAPGRSSGNHRAKDHAEGDASTVARARRPASVGPWRAHRPVPGVRRARHGLTSATPSSLDRVSRPRHRPARRKALRHCWPPASGSSHRGSAARSPAG